MAEPAEQGALPPVWARLRRVGQLRLLVQIPRVAGVPVYSRGPGLRPPVVEPPSAALGPTTPGPEGSNVAGPTFAQVAER